ncbi:PTS sugar transporter [Sporanaerobium hydrogeniformans]|uniref:PTS sugar transporter n=1 Tax=Sporanaerobium hydrogeniformans TaxID=3072179 RepID=A0AC61DEE7_9FIRM|nr:HPr family phosphocarrier protein [Sporanaerobium hydrogeniformans]PHV71520.1 PTS sugar transporter [Sporanaerobium hydrogeniformans]
MQSLYISLNSIEKVKQFVNLINLYEGDFDLSSGRYIIDAKSIMGIFSLDLSKPLRLDIYNNPEEDEIVSKLQVFLSE